jgi:hypothetical protein
MVHPVWCVHCSRVWDGGALVGTWPYLICSDPECGDGQPGTFMAYHQTRRLMAPHWPAKPATGQRIPLHPDGEDEQSISLTLTVAIPLTSRSGAAPHSPRGTG